MREQTPARAAATSEDAENILGQFYYAFGQGAGTIRVERAAVAALRRRYLPNIKTAPGPWSDVAGNVLSLLAQVGRLAALLATQDGRTAIAECDFQRARKMVEERVHPRANDTGKLIAGPFCMLVPDEEEATEPIDANDAPELRDIEPLVMRTN